MPDGPLRRVAASLLVLLVAVVSVAVVAPDASAHATLVSSSPADDETLTSPPSEVVLRFDEPVAASSRDAVTVLDPSGRHLERGRAVSRGGGTTLVVGVRGGGKGTYTVSYRLLSADTHVVTGSFVFHVGRASGPGRSAPAGPGAVEQVLGVIGRSLAFGGSLLAVGALVLALMVDRRRRPSSAEEGPGTQRWPTRRVWALAAVLSLLGAVLAAVVLSAELAGDSLPGGVRRLPELIGLLGWGDVAVLRVLVALTFALLVALPRRWVWPPAGAALVAPVLLCLPAFGGHASTTSATAEVVMVLHLLAAAAWVGGLVALVLSLPADRARLARFSRIALVSAGVVVLTGVASAVWLSGGREADVDAVVATGWWRALAVKLALVSGVVFLGWLHRSGIDEAGRPVSSMRASLRIEAVVAAAVVVATAVLVELPPPRDAVVVPYQAVRQAGEVTVRLQVVPAEAGTNALHLYFLAVDGSLTPIDATEVRVGSADVAARRVPVELITPSHATGSVELTPGTWTVEITVVRRGTRSVAELEVPIR